MSIEKLFCVGLALLLLLAFCSGCATMSPAEKAWQVMHVIDTAQTINGPARGSCYYENAPITRRLIGRKPSTEKVILWGISSSILHYHADRWLDNTNLSTLSKTIIRSISLTHKGIAIGNNQRIGIRIFGSNRCTDELY